MAKHKRSHGKSKRNPFPIYQGKDGKRAIGKVDVISKESVKAAEKNLTKTRKEAFKPISKANSILRGVKKKQKTSSKAFTKERKEMKRKGFDKVVGFVRSHTINKKFKPGSVAEKILKSVPKAGMTPAQKKQAELKAKLMKRHGKVIEAKRVIASHGGRLPGLEIKKESYASVKPRPSAKKPRSKKVGYAAQRMREETAGLKGAEKKKAAAKVKAELKILKELESMAKKNGKKPSAKKKAAKKSARKTKKNPMILANPGKSKKARKKSAKKAAKKAVKKSSHKKPSRKKARKASSKKVRKSSAKKVSPKKKASRKKARKSSKRSAMKALLAQEEQATAKPSHKRRGRKKHSAKKASGKKHSAKKSARKTKKNPFLGVNMSAISKFTQEKLGHKPLELTGLGAGGFLISLGGGALNKWAPGLRTTLAKVPVLGNFLANNATGIVALIVGGAANYYAKDEKIQAVAKGLIAASIVNLGSSLGVEAAKVAGLPAPMQGIVAIPNMSGPGASQDFGGVKVISAERGQGVNGISPADFGSAASRADFGKYNADSYDYSAEY